MTGGEIIVECLKAQGVRCLVGMPGVQNIHIYDALARSDEIEHLLIRNEQTATLVANGYARASGRVGVALTVSGPGASNAATGIGDACADSVPVLLVTGGTAVSSDGRDRSKCVHGLDQAAFFAPITRFFARPTTLQEIPHAVVGAFEALRAPRPGPAVIELPIDVVSSEGEVSIPEFVPDDRPMPDRDALGRAVGVLGGCNRWVILAGANVIEANATGPISGLAEQTQTPVIMTRLGKGAVPDTHPLAAGHCKAKLARTILKEADGVLIAGCRLTESDTSAWKLELPPTRVQLDPDPAEIGREYPVDLGVAGDLRQSLTTLLELIREGDAPVSAWNGRVDRLRDELTSGRPQLPIMSQMRRMLPDDAIVCVDVTSIAYRAFDEFPITVPRTFLYPCHYITLGFALPAAIGAKLALPDRRVVAFCGDGGFLMTACELATAADYGIDVLSVVINDGGLTAIEAAQAKAFEGRTTDTRMNAPHIADLARTMGARGIRVARPESFGAVFADVLDLEGPTVIEVMMEDRKEEIIRRIPWLYPDS